MEIVHQMIEVERRRVTARAFAFAEEDIFSPSFSRRGFRAVETSCHWIQLRRWREIEHVLGLRHMTDPDAVQDVCPFFEGANRIAIEVCGALLKLGEVFYRTKATLGAVDLLVEHTS